MSTSSGPPIHDEIRWAHRAFEVAAIGAALCLLGWYVKRLAAMPGALLWALPPAIAAGLAAADLGSGLVHWAADTWGSEALPVVGRGVLRPFRVHHVNPADFLRRDGIDTNGDVAALVSLVLAAGLAVPLDASWGPLSLAFVAGFGAGALPTNQVHQWAHMPQPPRAVRWLQSRGVILSRVAHARHHEAPHVVGYCIATGWLNGPLAAIDFFPRLEWLVTRVTGLRPRADDAAFRARAGAACRPASAPREPARSRS